MNFFFLFLVLIEKQEGKVKRMLHLRPYGYLLSKPCITRDHWHYPGSRNKNKTLPVNKPNVGQTSTVHLISICFTS
ncbi:hypothetical protein BDV25DRAFT_164822 [Aspergillus avenaceus]|uniref:Uncharacterized protein n=1 Tax=Aspergillus avenaceus TaxID=36643 RepID=A0A5N6TGY1_ASPAV|nr:hypothetical protein BDV25DRAFT_164822 [Aspergillus avenaceus]